MAVPMDNNSENSSRERVQRLYNNNVELESRRRKAAQTRIPSDPNTWQQMRENYEAIVLEDHAFSEQHEVEYALWQLHYRRIEELRAHLSAALVSTGSTAQNGRVPTRPGPDRVTKIRSQFKTFLSEATGFYHDLMLKIRAKYGLPLGYTDDPDNQIGMSKDGNKSAEVKKGLISCHRCLIYLGDLARYKGLYGEGDSKARDFAAASSYYMQASSLCPSSGNPHHQLAILASYSGDELVAIYRYFRSLAVENPFTTARDNLIIAFEKNRQSYSQLIGDAKSAFAKTVSGRVTGKGRGKGENKLPPRDVRAEGNLVKDKTCSVPDMYKAFSIRFVRLNGILFTRTSLETFGEVLSVVKRDLLELLSSGSDEECNFGADATECRLVIIRLITILMFTVHNVNRETDNQSYAEILQRSVLLQNAFTAIFEFMGLILGRCVQLNDPTGSYLLPGILVFVEWLACRHDIVAGSDMDEKQASAWSFFWNHCISFLNKLISSGCISADESDDETCFFNMSRYDEGETMNRLALFEDFELRGFLPLLPAQLILDFSRKHSIASDGGYKEKKARIQRIIAAGKALANIVRIGQEGIYFDSKSKRFVIGVEPQISDDYLFTSSEIPMLNGMQQEIQLENQSTLGFPQPTAQMYVDGEEEDEVIVFKPSMTEKAVDEMASIAKPLGVSMSGLSTSDVELGNGIGLFSTQVDGFLMQSASHTSTRPLSAVSDITAQYLQPTRLSTSKWLAESKGSIANGLASLNLLDNGFTKKLDLQDHLGVLQPTALSVPFPQSVSPTGGNNYSIQALETALPSKFDAFVSSASSFDRLPIKSPVGLKKNPVSRPVRHHGPPPGFGFVPPKIVDEPLPTESLKSENPLMDDYSWLDEYQLPTSAQMVGFNGAINQSAQTYRPVSMSNSSTGMLSFPFPGKQNSAFHVQKENPKGWPDYQFPDHMKQYQEQQQQLHKGNQLPRQYQGQSLWEGSFFV